MSAELSKTTTSTKSIEGITIKVAEHGDTTLIVGPGDKQTTFVVLSSATRLSNPVLHCMLHPESGFSEGHSVDHKVSFPEDDAPSFHILLRIAHLQFAKLPESMTIDELYHLTVLCEKYDAVSTLRPVSPFLRLFPENPSYLK